MEDSPEEARASRANAVDRSIEELPPDFAIDGPVDDPHHVRYKQARDYGAYCTRFASIEGCSDCRHHMVEKLMMCRWWNRTFWGRDIVTPEELRRNEELLKAAK